VKVNKVKPRDSLKGGVNEAARLRDTFRTTIRAVRDLTYS
jgi:hypothetical protein